MQQEITTAKQMQQLGQQIGELCCGGEVIELVGDIGAGKTTLTKGIARGMGIVDDVQSPTFTISRVYEAKRGLQLAHYDFYRLSDAGVMAAEVHETTSDTHTVTVVEWAEIVKDVLPQDTLTIDLVPSADDVRLVMFTAGGARSMDLIKRLEVAA